MTHYIRLPLEGTANTRDLGGYPTKDGHVTKWQVFVRSDDLYDLTDSDRRFLKDYGLKTVIDLRSTPELLMRPNPYADAQEVDYHNVSLFENASPEVLSKAPQDLLRSMYLEMLELHQAEIKAIFDIIAFAKPGMVLFHCAAGKDRTGVIAMLLMGLVKVANRDIVSNYEVSFTNLRRNAYFNQQENKHSPVILSTNTNMEDTIGFIRDKYKTVENYLLSIGVSPETLSLIKARFTE